MGYLFQWALSSGTKPLGSTSSAVSEVWGSSIEILSPEQSYKQVFGKLLHCAKYGTELGWLIDDEDKNILVVHRDRRVIEFNHGDPLPVFTVIDLELTVQHVFGFLSF